LREVLGELWIPGAVAAELRRAGRNRVGVRELEAAIGDWIRVAQVRDRELVERLSRRLGLGEREAIALAYERGATLLSDDRGARREAQRHGLRTTGLLAVLLEAKRCGLLPEVRPVLEELMAAGFRIAQDLYEAVLRQAGELRGPGGEPEPGAAPESVPERRTEGDVDT
jgi:predicted nucleic acid-binding protein